MAVTAYLVPCTTGAPIPVDCQNLSQGKGTAAYFTLTNFTRPKRRIHAVDDVSPR
jgi:hypothetical protein